MIKSQKINYYDDEVSLEGYWAIDETISDQRPVVLVAHDWSGKNAFACQNL